MPIADYALCVTRRPDFERFQEEIQELFADLYQVSRYAGGRHAFRPAADCYRTSDPPQLTIVLELAGIDPDTTEVIAADGVLIVTGERQRPRVDGPVYQQMEIEYGAFQRRIPLGEHVDVEAASATYARGILTIALPIVARSTRPARVPIALRTTS